MPLPEKDLGQVDHFDKKLLWMVENCVEKYLQEKIFKQTQDYIKVHIESIWCGEIYEKFRKKVNEIMTELYDYKLENRLKTVIKKYLPPSIIYVNDAMKPPPALLPFGVNECFVGPSRPCIYFLCKEDRIVYIGQSLNLTARLGQHILGKNFDRVFFMDVPKAELNKVETELIEYYDPEYNRSGFSRKIYKNLNERQKR